MRLEIDKELQDQVYSLFCQRWSGINRLFSLEEKEAPLLVLPMGDLSMPGLICLPKEPDPKREKEIRKDVLTTVVPAFYSQNTKSIVAYVFGNDEEETQRWSRVITHELTHAAIEFPKVPTNLEEIEKIRYLQLGERIAGILEKAMGKADDLCLSLSEFFVPLSQSHFGYDANETDWEEAISQLERQNTSSDQRVRYEALMRTKLLVDHLPQIAGERFLDSHGGDTLKVLEDHPKLTQTAVASLKEDYCMPFLYSE
jgi:hypothetical protein